MLWPRSGGQHAPCLCSGGTSEPRNATCKAVLYAWQRAFWLVHDSRCRVCQGFRTPEEVKRFGDMMDEMCHIVATKHSGSLKGEHSTGRNMAPYVELEWGTKVSKLLPICLMYQQ